MGSEKNLSAPDLTLLSLVFDWRQSNSCDFSIVVFWHVIVILWSHAAYCLFEVMCGVELHDIKYLQRLTKVRSRNMIGYCSKFLTNCSNGTQFLFPLHEPSQHHTIDVGVQFNFLSTDFYGRRVLEIFLPNWCFCIQHITDFWHVFFFLLRIMSSSL